MRLRDREGREQEPLSPSFKPPKKRKYNRIPPTHPRQSSAYRNIKNLSCAPGFGSLARRKIAALKFLGDSRTLNPLKSAWRRLHLYSESPAHILLHRGTPFDLDGHTGDDHCVDLLFLLLLPTGRGVETPGLGRSFPASSTTTLPGAGERRRQNLASHAILKVSSNQPRRIDFRRFETTLVKG